ncbi:SRPBCC family protein [Gordonia sp. NPDC003376]
MGRIARHGRTELITSASPESLWRIISDVSRTGEWSHECRRAHLRRTGGPVVAPGIRFRGVNRSGPFTWTRLCVVTTVDPPHHLAWRTVGLWGHVDSTQWRIDLEPVGTRTRIVQTYDVVHAVAGADRIFWVIVKAHRDRRDALMGDLERLAALATD